MSEIVESLEKLASDLTDRVDELERENTALKARLDEAEKQAKTASVVADPKPVVSAEVVNKTLEALVKCGALSIEQLDESRNVLMNDAEAPHRLLCKIIDAQAQAKTAASVDHMDNVEGGTVVGDNAPARDRRDDCYERMAAILGM